MPLLEAQGIVKRFGGHVALAGVSLAIDRGEVLAVVGENGAGKSTLMAVLAGALAPDEGAIRWDGRPVRFATVAEALEAGIGLVHQEPQLVPALSVAENLLLGRLPRRGPFVDRRALGARARAALESLALDLPLDRPVGALGAAARQLVAVARVLGCGARLVLLDEPTSSLSPAETARLFDLLRTLAASGAAIVYISHRLEEVRAIAGRVVVLRDGRVTLEAPMAETSNDALLAAMSGTAAAAGGQRAPASAEPLLEVIGLRRRGRLHGISLVVRRGERVGLAGLVGSGRSRLLRSIFGAEPVDAGSVRVHEDGTVREVRDVASAVAAGIGFVPEDRRHQGLVMQASVAENVGLARPPGSVRAGWLRRSRLEAAARRAVAELGIRARSVADPVRALSGGNQQKVLLARWLRPDVRLLLLDEPTRGVDVVAKAEIHRHLHALAARGVGLLVASSEIEELTALCDRLYVLRAGAVAGELGREQADPTAILRLATGAA